MPSWWESRSFHSSIMPRRPATDHVVLKTLRSASTNYGLRTTTTHFEHDLRGRSTSTNFAILFQTITCQTAKKQNAPPAVGAGGASDSLRNPGLWSHSRECVLHSRILHRCFASAAHSRSCRASFRHWPQGSSPSARRPRWRQVARSNARRAGACRTVVGNGIEET